MILGVDPGTSRVGVAVADLETRFATPLEVIDVATTEPIARLCELAEELGADVIVVGRPLGLSGTAGPSAETQRQFTDQLRAATTVPVVEFDERLTSVVAERAMRAGGASAATRKKMRDAVAAQVMLQGYLDATA